MPSSPIPAARSQYLLDLLAQVPDPRKRRGRRHALAGLLAVGIAAVVAGSRSFAAIGQWASDAGAGVLTALGASRGAAVGQVAVAAKSNEIPAVRNLLTAFTNLAGAVITMDAMHTQTDTAELVI